MWRPLALGRNSYRWYLEARARGDRSLDHVLVPTTPPPGKGNSINSTTSQRWACHKSSLAVLRPLITLFTHILIGSTLVPVLNLNIACFRVSESSSLSESNVKICGHTDAQDACYVENEVEQIIAEQGMQPLLETRRRMPGHAEINHLSQDPEIDHLLLGSLQASTRYSDKKPRV
jgi:hypothetical protein